MSMKVLLLENVEHVGKMGEEAVVADGFARNFLLPRRLGIVLESAHQHHGRRANTGLLRQLERKKAKAQAEYDREVAEAKQRAAEINSQTLTIAVQAQEDGKLFGSVGPQQIGTALKELGIEIDRRKIALAEPIREVGMTTVDILLHPEVTASVKVWVVKMDV